MKLTAEIAADVVYGETHDWHEVSGTKHPVSHGRWSVSYEAVFLHAASGKHYLFHWSVGATENQDETAYQYGGDVEPTEVVEKEVTIKQWVPV